MSIPTEEEIENAADGQAEGKGFAHGVDWMIDRMEKHNEKQAERLQNALHENAILRNNLTAHETVTKDLKERLAIFNSKLEIESNANWAWAIKRMEAELIDTEKGDVHITLPHLAPGQTVYITNNSDGTVTVSPPPTERISEHKPCPFCGSDRAKPETESQLFDSYAICCRVCFSEGPTAANINDAWEYWDKRHG